MRLHEAALAELRVPVQRLHVDVLTELDHRAVTLFLAPGRSVSDLLEGDDAFFPVEDEGGAVRLYARRAVLSIAELAEGVANDAFTLLQPGCEVRLVGVHLRNGHTLRGRMSLSGLRRTQDFINLPTRSFPLHVDLHVHHIAKDHVVRIEELR